MEQKINLREILESHRGERHVVVLHSFPDPDAISCAFTHRLISEQFDIDVQMLYSGRISHQQNVALVRLLGVELIQYNSALDLSQWDAAVFIDNQGTTIEEIVSGLAAADVPILLVVDHHQLQDRLKAQFNDIRATGATATIYTSYLEQGALELDSARKEHVVAATALMHGILSDTAGFVRAGGEDFRAAAYLSRFRDAEMLEQIMSQARSKHDMDIIYRALGNRVIAESVSVAGIGYLRAEDRDAIPEAAEFLLTEENVHTAIVYGIIVDSDQDEEALVGSLRTAKLTLDPDEFIKVVFGKNGSGHYFGGGKMSAGAFSIPIGFLAGDHGEKFQNLKWQVYDAQIKAKVFARIGVDQKLFGKD
jgi:nanoRNase/pAp phosphatase (c-di-AMP/oligoRNAs hydrolase)